MGMHPGAKLCFGVDLGEEVHPFKLNEGDFATEEEYEEAVEQAYEDFELDDYIAKRRGIHNPWNDVPRDIYNGYDQSAWEAWKTAHPEWQKAYDEYHEKLKQIREEAPVEIEFYGNMAYSPSYRVLTLKGHTVSGDYCSQVTLPSEPTLGKIKHAEEFCRENGLADFTDPCWLMLADFG